MSDEMIFAEERQNKIVSMLKSRNKLFVNELCELFGVSTVTIRNDLNQLEKNGLLKRTHGGAIPCVKTGFEQTSQQKSEKKRLEKERIARAAAKLIEDGDTVAIDTGTTAYALAEVLDGKQNVTVVTTDIKIANLLEKYQGISVIIAGGKVRKGFTCTVGAITNSILSEFNVDKAFIATNAVTSSGRLCTPDIEQAQVKKQLINMGTQVILICDSSKFGSHSFADFGSLSSVDIVITDEMPDESFIKLLKENNTEIEVAGK